MYGIDATSHTHRESQCLPYAGFLLDGVALLLADPTPANCTTDADTPWISGYAAQVELGESSVRLRATEAQSNCI